MPAYRTPRCQQWYRRERTFLTHSPRIAKVVVERHNKVRRARLYFLRTRTGKSARLKQRF